MRERGMAKPPWWRRRNLVWACSYIASYACVLLIKNQVVQLRRPFGLAGGLIEWGGAAVCLLLTGLIVLWVVPAAWWAAPSDRPREGDERP